MEINHRDAEYQIARYKLGRHKFNGAYFYSKEICANIIPNVKTDRNWITVKGRTAIEAKILGCEILPFHPRLMDTELWQVLDNKEAAEMLQKMLDEIDGGGDADM